MRLAKETQGRLPAMHWEAWWKKTRAEGGQGVRQVEGFVQTGDDNTAHLETRFIDDRSGW